MTVIDFNKFSKSEKENTFIDQLDYLVKQNGKTYMDKFIQRFFLVMLHEIRVGVGLEEDKNDNRLPFFDVIDHEYQQVANGCYFCSHTDPNADKFVPGSAKLCMMCAKKVVNILTAIGADQTHLRNLRSILAARRTQDETTDTGISK